jgi:ATPase subunit of ABC transporter with duplicated ATPase domains
MAGRCSCCHRGAGVGYLAQSRQRPPTSTVGQYLREHTGLEEAEAELGSAARALASDMDETAQERYSRALERFNRLDAADFDDRAARALADLGADARLMAAPVATLSGGELARVGLAALILARFDITLLDEPTNDLDFDGLERLEQLVTALTGGVVIVSHDRAFLARTVTSVLEMDLHTRQATFYDGGWSAYLQEKVALARHRQEAFQNYQQARQELTGRAQRERQWATAGVSRERRRPRDNDKAQRDFRVNRTEQLAARARRTEKAMERLVEVDSPWEDWELHYTVKLAPRAGAVVASLDGAVMERGNFRLGPVDMAIEWGARLAVTGRNGSGKTTLVEALLGRLPPSAGSATLGPSVVPGELGQERSRLLAADTGPTAGADLLATFLTASGLMVPDARSLLAKFGLGAEHVSRPLPSLSPGERTRAQLACFQAVGVNFLVLDEPTNHLDLPAIEQLEAALASYEGTLLIVTHDRRLLEGLRLTQRAEVADGQVRVLAV